jgi:6-phosphogluconate dehydrogenase
MAAGKKKAAPKKSATKKAAPKKAAPAKAKGPKPGTKHLAMIGLGKMGGNMVQRLLNGGHQVSVFDRSDEAVKAHVAMGATGAKNLKTLCASLPTPRIVWIMVPAGKPVDDTIDGLLAYLSPGDIIIDGGNSNFHDTMRRAESLKAQSIHFVDSGTSGGIWGLQNGYCLMIGATDAAFKECQPIFKTLAPTKGYAHVGPPGAGHYVKMIHNGIEYGLLQAYAEGYEILHASKHFKLNLFQIAAVWNRGSVVRSWLNELAERAFAGDSDLKDLKGFVNDSGEGRWTVQEAIDLDVPAPIITESLLVRFRSRQAESYGAKVIAALRNQFGGHAVQKS